ncbi:MAG: hypothetical protein ACYTAF_00025 [Planctomycetota bacterium]|jgi:hypothetical protein
MQRTLLILLVVVAAPFSFSCGLEEIEQEHPHVKYIPPIPPEQVLRHPVEWTFRDETEMKMYNLRLYKQPAFPLYQMESFEEVVVTVVELQHPEEGERLATPEEYEFARAKFEEQWLKKQLDEKMQYHRQMLRAERHRSASLIKQRIRLKKEAIAEIEDKKFEIDAEIRARKELGTDGDTEHMDFLEKQSDRYYFELTVRQAELEILNYKAWLLHQPD